MMKARFACAGRARLVALALALALALTSAVASAPAAPGAPVLSATVTPGELPFGAGLTVTGSLADAGHGVGAAPLALQADPYPFRRFATVARLTTVPDGSFSFVGIRLDRNTRVRVVLEGSSGVASPQLPVIVDPTVAINARSLGPGQTHLSVRVRHTPYGGSASVSAWWFVAARGTRVFRLAVVTSTRELSPGLTYASATVYPPSKRFLYRVCLNPTWERAMGPPAAHGPCPEHDFTVRREATSALEYQGEGRGTPLAAYPSPGAIAAATSFLDARAGRTSFAVLDSKGQLSGVRLHERFETASVVKVMMLVAYLQMLNARHRGLDGADASLLYPMIHISDNNAASAVLAIVGDAALVRVARESGMADYAPGVGWWAYTQTSAADQARFFFALERLVPPQFYGYARELLAGIEPSQSWGVPPVARPRWHVFFKTGALPSQGLFNEVARLERPGVTFTIAVFTDGDPSMSYGEQTIEGLAARLLARSP
jgi:hypothetical protein